MLAKVTLKVEAGLFQNALGADVGRIADRFNPVEMQGLEAELYQ